MFGASAAQAVNIEVKLGLMPAGLPAGAVAEVARDLAWLADLTDGAQAVRGGHPLHVRAPYAA